MSRTSGDMPDQGEQGLPPGKAAESTALTAGNERFDPFRDAAVDMLVSEWAEVLPGYDMSAREIIASISRIQAVISSATSRVLERYSLLDTEFRLLAGLRRSGAPYRRSPSEISPRYVPVTSGGLTGMINRLERRGLVTRQSNPHDRRGVLVELTNDGLMLIEQAMTAVAEMELKLLAAVSQEERRTGTEFLRKLLRAAHSGLGASMD